ncbi:DUF3332 family protein [Leptospira sp. GIMC2001]|uniref:DUF3332 family protein n=1 Tax=Leptospira sp. GIMC2001 TaxID=1513297 RepID=UPI002349EBF0|nr:DUF3332 family protein [Leptospira sp. GIMC2001]WCL48825.1 DUF3332 family protein [Leptospira sp. GIMC2001]
MLITTKFKKAVTVLCIALASVFSFANCFGSFGIVKTVYNAHKGLKIGSGMLAKFIQTILMYFPFSILYAIGFLADVILFNLVEFWTNSNPVAMSEFDMDGKLVRNYQQGSDSVTLTYSEFGKKMNISISSAEKTEEFVVLKEKEGVLFKEVDGKLVEIDVNEKQIGSNTILKMVENGKLISTKVIKTEDLKAISDKYSI